MTEDLKKRRVEKTLDKARALIEKEGRQVEAGEHLEKESILEMLTNVKREIQKTYAVRLPDSLVAKVDEIADALSHIGKSRINRSKMIRYAITTGLEAIEAELKRRKN